MLCLLQTVVGLESFSDWLFAPGSSHVSHGLRAHFFSALYNIPLSGWTSLCIHSPPAGHLGDFFLEMVDRAAVSAWMQVFLCRWAQLLWVSPGS